MIAVNTEHYFLRKVDPMLRLIASLIIIVAGFAAPLNAEDAKDKAPAKAPDKPVADKPAFHLSPMILILLLTFIMQAVRA